MLHQQSIGQIVPFEQKHLMKKIAISEKYFAQPAYFMKRDEKTNFFKR